MKKAVITLALLATSAFGQDDYGREGPWGEADKKADEEHSRGLEIPPGWPTPDSSFTIFAVPGDSAAIPPKFEWKTNTPIRNQGACGSCWAFATTSVVESLGVLTGTNNIDLSEQATLDCSRAGSCRGGFFEAFNWLTYPGASSELQYPYRGIDNMCPYNLLPIARLFSWSYVGQPGREPSLEELKLAVYYYGPIAVAVNGSFGAYTGGVFNKCNTAQVDHMVTLEGWDDSKQAWRVRNSWGTQWGEQGWAWVKYHDSYGRKCNGIGSIAAFAVLAKPLRVEAIE